MPPQTRQPLPPASGSSPAGSSPSAGSSRSKIGVFLSKTGVILSRIENGACYIMLGCLALLPVGEIVIARLFKTGIPHSEVLLPQFLLLTGLLTGMITTKSHEHISIALVQNFCGEAVKRHIAILTNLLAALILTVITFCGVCFVLSALSPPSPVLGWVSNQVIGIILPLGYGVMTARFVREAARRGAPWWACAIALVLGVLCAFPVITKIIWQNPSPPEWLTKLFWGFPEAGALPPEDMTRSNWIAQWVFDHVTQPDWVSDLIDTTHSIAYYLRTPAVILLIVAAFAGTPLFVIMGGLVLVLLHASWGEMDATASDVYTTLTLNDYIPIPLFTVMGFFLSESKAGERLIQTFRSLFSWLPGGMIIAAVVICAFFTSFTGASGVTILALGGLLYTILSSHGRYSERFSIGLLTSVGSIGLLFPPSIPLMLVGTAAMTDVRQMFLGGIIPGLILVAAVGIFGIITSVKTHIPVETFNLRRAGRSIKDAAFEILLPILLICGLLLGILDAIKIGAAGVVYVFLVEVGVHQDIRLRDVPKVLAKAVPIIGGVLSIVALSKSLSFYIVSTQAPQFLADWMTHAVESKYVFLLILNLALLIVGCLMDIFSAILIMFPLILPLGVAYGIDPVHLGIIFITNLEVGFLTPPMGMNLFLATYRFEKPFTRICRYVLPFLGIQLVVVLLVTYVPWFSTWFYPLVSRLR